MIELAQKNASQFAYPENALKCALWDFLDAFHEQAEKDDIFGLNGKTPATAWKKGYTPWNKGKSGYKKSRRNAQL